MFKRLGEFAAHYRYWIVAAWVAAAVILLATAPNLEDVSSTDQKDYLPADAPFAKAQELYEKAFPDEFAPSSTIVLIDAGADGDVHDAAVWDYMGRLEAWLNSDEAPDNVENVAAPTTDPDFADALISPDKRIALVSAAMNTPTDAAVTTRAVEAIDAWLEANEPEGFTVYQTGEAALNAQAEESTFTTMDRTLIITLALVVVALLTIYRSPVSPLIPLLAVTMAFLTTISLVAILASWDVINVITQLNAILVVVMYGAGTDYCLFLISRFREEMADDIGVENATRRTVHLVGETISSSAATIFVGFVSMTFAEIGAMRSAGPMLAIGIVMSLLAGLTLVPALLAILGNRAFWPGKASHRSTGRFYEITSKQVSSRPLVTIVVIVAIMTPFSIYGLGRDFNFDMVSELPEHIPSVEAYNLLREHMGGGNLFPITVVVTGRAPEALAPEIIRLGQQLRTLDGVVDVRSLNSPLGVNDTRFNNLMRVDGQLNVLLALDDSDQGVTDIDPAQAVSVIQGMQRYMALIMERFPEVADDPDLQTAKQIVDGGLLAIMARQDDLMAAVTGLVERFKGIEDAYLFPPTGAGDMFELLDPLVKSYVAEANTAYRVDVVLDDPLGEAGMHVVAEIRGLLGEYGSTDKAAVSGMTVMLYDLRDVLNRDELRSFGFILAGIFLVLLVMLRSIVAPIYLIGTVVLSFTCTLGITNLFFQVVYGREKLSWMLPLFMFVFLVALGIDYSIFLFGRIKEEVAHHGIREGVHVAVARTGAIITSAGVILAGTFAGMMTGEIMFLAQLGFAVSVGVLIDTFVVRTMLDPALATLFGRWTWWPGGVPKAAPSDEITAAPPAGASSKIRP
ncbi:MAG: MMPL family transporter [Anaerolineae bacterium]|nr:MMPL family transporter [Anaerolineae bacterium]